MAPMFDVLADLRRGLPLLAVATLAGAVLAGGLALRDARHQVATATLLVASRSDESRTVPVAAAELEALLEPAILAPAAAAVGMGPAELAPAVDIVERPSPGLYDVSVSLWDGQAARKAADVLVHDLAALLVDLRSRKLELAQAGLSPAFERARRARENAEAAYLADLEAGAVEAARAVNGRAPSADHAAAFGRAKAQRERLRLAFERASQEERWSHDAVTRTTLELDAREPQATVWAEAGPPVARRRSAGKAAASGAALAFVVAFAGILAFRELRRSPPAGSA